MPNVAADGPTPTPTSPRGLVADLTTDGQGVILSWEPPMYSGSTAITEYQIYRDGVLLDDVAAPNLSFIDPVVDLDAIYFVTAVNSAGEGPPSLPTNLVFSVCFTVSISPPGAAVDPTCIKNLICSKLPPPLTCPLIVDELWQTINPDNVTSPDVSTVPGVDEFDDVYESVRLL